MSRARAARVAVIGAGLTGLSAAYRLSKQGLDVQVFEALPEVGGRTRTIRKDGFVFDVGAITMLPTYAAVRALLEELGVQKHLHRVQPVIGIPRQGQMHHLDIGHPWQALLGTRLISWRAKARLAKLLPSLAKSWRLIDYCSMSALADWDHESVADYVRRELGEEIHEYVAGPVIRGNTLNSTRSAPFGELLWMLRQYAQPCVYGLDQGINFLAESLAARLPVTFNATVDAVAEEGRSVVVSGHRGGVRFTERFDAGIVALPPQPLLQVVHDLARHQREFLESIKPLPSINVHLGLSRRPARTETFILPPESEQRDLTTIVFDHLKAPGRAPDGKGVISLFCRDSWARRHADAGDDVILAEVLRMAEPFVGDLRGDIESVVVQRWPYSIIKSEVGLYRSMRAYECSLDPRRRLQIGSDFLSLGMEAAVVSGQKLASNIVGTLM